MLERLIEAERVVVGSIFGLLAAVAGVLDPLMQLIAATAETWLPFIMYSSQYLTPHVAWLDQALAQQVLVMAVVVYLGVLAGRLWDQSENIL